METRLHNSSDTLKKAAHFWLLFCAALLLSLPVIVYGLPKRSHDGVIHAIWYTHFATQLWAGDLYPHWLQGMNGGLGSPVFFYYGSVPYYLTGWLRPLLHNDQHGWHQLGLSAALALFTSGVFAYLWLKSVYSHQSALVGAIFYMAMPYHLAVDLYERGAFAEFWAFAWMPLILFFVCNINRRQLALLGLAVSYALLIMTHLPTTLVFSLIPVSYASIRSDRRQRLKSLGMTVGAMALGAGLAAIYLFPAMLTQASVSIEKTRIGFYYYENHFLFTSLKGRFPLLLSCFILLTIGLATCAYLYTRRSSHFSLNRENTFWFVTATISVFMMTPLSHPVWQAIPTLQAIQFPWRFGTVLTVATTELLTAAVFLITSTSERSFGRALMKPLAWAFLTTSVLVTVFTTWDAFLFKSGDRGDALTVTDHEPERINYLNEKLEISKGTPGFHPRWAAPLEMNSLESLIDKIGTQNGALVRANITRGTGHLQVDTWRPRDIGMTVDSSDGVTLNVSQFYYPGWSAKLIDGSQQLLIQPSSPDGLLTMDVPGGHHLLSLRLMPTPQEEAGRVVSAISAAVIPLLIILSSLLRRWRSR
jgi:hypothetical protein